ncbi:ATP-dependent DNA helicase RecG [Acinetobacter marinus]|uniref:ATP-dependent DNA helicase RecG n=1 Tax=Acinetobacter marinus TaxID=281375 RepID=A0A1G6MXE7_9GAMM|nr:ATP-binding protein [Acinetobacter marinus]SDC60278.1 ATP-dependent DNA helicase RecG [Acinetobacter marinus]
MQTVFSKLNTIITKEYLQQQRENQYFERKGLGEKEIKPTKIAEELIGMLNADGGVLVFGVSDSGEIQDLKSLNNLESYRKLAFDFIEPPCAIELEEIEIDGNLVFLFHVEQELERVFQRKDNQKVYLRVSDENRELDRERVRKLEYDKMIRHFEEEIVSNFDQNDLDETLLATYQEKLNYSKGSFFDLLNKRHLVDKKEQKYQFKNAAILLFAKDPEKYIPSASVRYIRYQGTEAKVGEEHNAIKDERFENNIPNLIDELRVFLKASFKDYYFLDITEGKFLKVPEYPEAAWLEGIVNALCHRSYNVQGNSVYIKHFDDRIEISNSGPLPAQVTIENIKTERFARNPRLTRVLEDLGYVRQLNEGVSRIYESMERSMLSLPEYKERNGSVILTLKNRISDHTKTIDTSIMKEIERNFSKYNETQKNILNYLFHNGSATVLELSEHTKINENTIRSYLNAFITENLIDRQSVKKRDINAKYIIKKR